MREGTFGILRLGARVLGDDLREFGQGRRLSCGGVVLLFVRVGIVDYHYCFRLFEGKWIEIVSDLRIGPGGLIEKRDRLLDLRFRGRVRQKRHNY